MRLSEQTEETRWYGIITRTLNSFQISGAMVGWTDTVTKWTISNIFISYFLFLFSYWFHLFVCFFWCICSKYKKCCLNVSSEVWNKQIHTGKFKQKQSIMYCDEINHCSFTLTEVDDFPTTSYRYNSPFNLILHPILVIKEVSFYIVTTRTLFEPVPFSCEIFQF